MRGRAASALARRKSETLPTLLTMLESPRLETRYGACEALKTLKGAAAPAVPTLRKTLEAEDLWLRIEAAEALAATGEPGQAALPQLLRMITKGPTKEDPRAMEQRYLCFTVFGQMLKRSIEGVDRDLLRAAVEADLKNQDGRSRGTIGGIYDMLTYEEIKPLLPAVYEATKTPSPSGIMFASGIRVNGLNILAKHRIKEGLPLCVEVMEIQKWGKAGRIPKCLDAIETYGPAAKAILPQLKELEKEFASHREAKKLLPFAERLGRIIQKLETTPEGGDLRSLKT